MCNVLKKPFLKSLSISDEILSKFGVCSTPECQRVTSKGSRTMGSEWPDKRDKTRCGHVARGGGEFFSRGHPPQLNSVGFGVVWVTGLFSLCLPQVNNLLIIYSQYHGCGFPGYARSQGIKTMMLTMSNRINSVPTHTLRVNTQPQTSL